MVVSLHFDKWGQSVDEHNSSFVQGLRFVHEGINPMKGVDIVRTDLERNLGDIVFEGHRNYELLQVLGFPILGGDVAHFSVEKHIAIFVGDGDMAPGIDLVCLSEYVGRSLARGVPVHEQSCDRDGVIRCWQVALIDIAIVETQLDKIVLFIVE